MRLYLVAVEVLPDKVRAGEHVRLSASNLRLVVQADEDEAREAAGAQPLLRVFPEWHTVAAEDRRRAVALQRRNFSG